MTATEERAVIEKVLGGETDAFEALVLDNQKKVYSLALKMTGDENDALDIAQEAFLKAYTRLGSFRGESRFSVWLYRLTYNICIDFIRKSRRTRTASLTYTDDDGDFFDLEIADTRYEPAAQAERRSVAEAIDRGVRALPDKHREILLLREMAGLSYEDIAATLRLSEGTVKSRLSRARRSLAALLADNGTFSGGSRHKDAKEVDGRD